MQLTLPRKELEQLIARQLGSLFVWLDDEAEVISRLTTLSLARCERGFTHIANKYYSDNGEARFDPFHSGQYTFFLYQLSHLAWKEAGNRSLADRIYYLNKALNGLDLFYEVELPPVWCCDHPVGSVIGRGKIGNYFSFIQGCTIGNNGGVFPTLGQFVWMLSGSKVLGNCTIGDEVVLGANTLVKDEDIPGRSLVFGASPNLVIKPLGEKTRDRLMKKWRIHDL